MVMEFDTGVLGYHQKARGLRILDGMQVTVDAGVSSQSLEVEAAGQVAAEDAGSKEALAPAAEPEAAEAEPEAAVLAAGSAAEVAAKVQGEKKSEKPQFDVPSLQLHVVKLRMNPDYVPNAEKAQEKEDGEGGREPERSTGVAAPRGVYLHGGTGCGKTMMVDRFFAPSVAPPRGASPSWVRRVHLHEFMSEVHKRAHALRLQTPTMGDPVPYLAHEIICQTQVLLLDEVAVTDVADALMIRKLFRR